MATYEAAVAPVKQRLVAQLLANAGPGGPAGAGAAASSSGAAASAAGRAGGQTVRILECGIGTGAALGLPHQPFARQRPSRSIAPQAPTCALPRSAPPPPDPRPAGPNLPLYAAAAGADTQLDITGLDPNTAMQPYAAAAADQAGLGQQLRLVVGSAEQMPFEDASFDAVACTLVLCSVPQPVAALREMRRVLRPGGQLLLIEHVVAPTPGLTRLAQAVFDPLQQVVADGCHLTRDTAAAVEAAGWDVARLERLTIPGIAFLGPHIAGVLPR